LANSGTAIGDHLFLQEKIELKKAFLLRFPLLNDNKITGAKTYCCSSGSNEITLDEIEK
jgi:hypothetical protein